MGAATRSIACCSLLFIGCGGSGDVCLQPTPQGVLPTATDWVVWKTFPPSTQQSDWGFVAQGQFFLPPVTNVLCKSPSPGRDVPGYTIWMWFDSRTQSPLESYCMNALEDQCQPQPGQPSGQATFVLKNEGVTTVAVPISSP